MPNGAEEEGPGERVQVVVAEPGWGWEELGCWGVSGRMGDWTWRLAASWPRFPVSASHAGLVLLFMPPGYPSSVTSGAGELSDRQLVARTWCLMLEREHGVAGEQP